MSTVQAIAKPLHVSPVIKFFRWSFLLSGIVYGLYHQRRFTKKENAFREQELKEKPIRDAKLAAEKKATFEAEMKMLNEIISPPKK